MKTRSIGCMIVAILAAGEVGYRLGAEREDSVSWLARETTPPLEYYAAPESFSEVEDAKSSLQALCLRFTTAVHAKMVAAYRSQVGPSGAGSASEPHLKDVIEDLEQGMREFAGTEQELDVAQDLLLALKKAKQLDRWIDVYLKELYEHPTHPVVARLADEAVSIANQCGRQQSVAAGLLYLQSIPAKFQGNNNLAAALLHAGNRSQLATHDDQNLQVGHN